MPIRTGAVLLVTNDLVSCSEIHRAASLACPAPCKAPRGPIHAQTVPCQDRAHVMHSQVDKVAALVPAPVVTGPPTSGIQQSKRASLSWLVGFGLRVRDFLIHVYVRVSTARRRQYDSHASSRTRLETCFAFRSTPGLC